jgi:hypothetical protein
MWPVSADREKANKQALRQLLECEPVLVDVKPAIEVVPGMRKNMILASGVPRSWSDIVGIQRRAFINGVLYEGLATDAREAEARLEAGEIEVAATQLHGCVGAGAGITTASMPVYVVENKVGGNRGTCSLVESNPPRVFAYGAWGDDVRAKLDFSRDVLAPVIGDAARRAGGIPLKPIMRRAIGMGDDLHFRNDAGTQLFMGALYPHLLELARERLDDVRRTVAFMQATPVAFLRVAAAAAKTCLDAAHGVEGSSLVTGIVYSSKGGAMRVSGLGDAWFHGPLATFLGDFFWGSGPEDVAFAGGESTVMETIGLGALVMAGALAMPFGPVATRIERNRKMYEITVGENQEYKIPYFDRGAPTGIDIFKVVETGIKPFIHGGVIRKDGEGAAGVGAMECAIEPFQAAVAAFRERYPDA